MKIAIIGGSSTVGQNLLKHLLKKKFKLIATYYSNFNFIKKKNISWKKLNINEDNENYYKYLEYPDIVVNLVWPDIPNYKSKNHFKTYKLQKKFNYNLIKNGLKNLIVLGTCYEYGKVKGEISELTKEKPTVPYGISKLKLLKSLKKLKKKKHFKFTWFRPFFVYGENKKRITLFTLIKDFEKKKINKLKVCGNLIRDFVPMDYLSSVLTKIITLNNGYDVVNVCTGKGISVKDFVKKNIKNKKKLKKIDMNGKNKNSFEPNSFWGNNSKLKKILNY